MMQKNIVLLIGVGFMAALISFLVTSTIFGTSNNKTKVPIILPIDGTFPDVKNDSAYSSFLNPQALDLTVPVQIGDNQNSDPFSGGQ